MAVFTKTTVKGKRGRPGKVKSNEDKAVEDEIKEVKEFKEKRESGFTHEQLHDCLFHVEDVMDRALLKFVCLRDTARDVKSGTLTMDKIEVGVRNPEMSPERVFTLNQWLSNLEEVKKEDKIVGWKGDYNGVPFEIKNIHREYAFIDNPDSVVYSGVVFAIPNQWERYWKSRNLIQ